MTLRQSFRNSRANRYRVLVDERAHPYPEVWVQERLPYPIVPFLVLIVLAVPALGHWTGFWTMPNVTLIMIIFFWLPLCFGTWMLCAAAAEWGRSDMPVAKVCSMVEQGQTPKQVQVRIYSVFDERSIRVPAFQITQERAVELEAACAAREAEMTETRNKKAMRLIQERAASTSLTDDL